ncbi:Swt1 family HEPN domain-containing protein [Sulfitobacter sp. AS59]|uniref:Swt1 family HEPN domain-containing protein n=1 Tax=Sulfitobacter sp. AS59 TaxID=3135784 RepID=UPI003171273B
MTISRKSEMIVRAFGMSGAQIQSELKNVSEQTGHRLLVVRDEPGVRKLEQYKNFEGNVRAEAARMSEYYEIFYCLEVSIRNLIKDTLIDAEGSGWWETQRVAEGIRIEVKRNRDKEQHAGLTLRSADPIDYTTFGQLSQLITDNFELFEPVLSSKSAVSRVLNQLNLLRGPIAHCCSLAADESDRLELSVRDWFRLLS